MSSQFWGLLPSTQELGEAFWWEQAIQKGQETGCITQQQVLGRAEWPLWPDSHPGHACPHLPAPTFTRRCFSA